MVFRAGNKISYVIDKELKMFDYDKLFKKCLLILVYKYKNIIPIYEHKFNKRFKKNINITISGYTSLWLKKLIKYCNYFV